MKSLTALKPGLILTCICVTLFWNPGFSQERYLMVVDIQEFQYKRSEVNRSVQEMIRQVNAIVDRFDPDRVIYIQAMGRVLNLSFRGFSLDTLPAAAFDRSLHIVSDHVFTKIEGDAFTSPEMNRFLASRGAREIILVGLMAGRCVYDTAMGGKEKGYDMLVVPEGVAGMTPGKKEKALKKMKHQGIAWVPMAELVHVP